MSIILVGGEKGGTGKSSIATNLAALRALAGRDVLLVDTDVQASASFWAQTRDEGGMKPRVACIQKFGNENLPSPSSVTASPTARRPAMASASPS